MVFLSRNEYVQILYCLFYICINVGEPIIKRETVEILLNGLTLYAYSKLRPGFPTLFTVVFYMLHVLWFSN